MTQDFDRIFVRDLELEMSIGILQQEKETPQRVIINVAINVETNQSKVLEDIGEVVSYKDIIDGITTLCRAKHYNLAEKLCEDIAALCLGYEQSLHVTVRVEKPDIIEKAGAVGAEIQRRKIR